jgi:serine/threonine-protein kinase
MAIVYLAHDLRQDRLVAVKVLGAHLARAPGRDRFVREISIAANLTHPHILPLHDSGEADGQLFYVMPYVAGESLRARLRRERQLPVEDALHVAREVGDALDYAHRQGVVHRDVKPDNILMADGHALLTDFGVARAAMTSGITQPALTSAGLAVGTVEYMSPEQAAGEPEVGPASDQYALACVVYEMLAGEAPFAGPTPQSVVARQLAGPPARLRALRPSVPQTVEAAVTKALARDAADRYPGVADFVRVLTGATPAHVQIERPELSIAVLPFASLSEAMADEFFSDGITEDIITQLSKISALKVISRTSVMRFKKTTSDLREIASVLGVAHVLEGSVRRAGDRLRITAQLIDGRTDRHLWADTYDRQLADVFEIQSEVAQAIAGALRARLTPEEQSRLLRMPSVDVDTYHDMLLGRHHWHRWTEAGFHESLSCFDRAILRTPSHAPAHAWRGIACAALSLGYWRQPAGTFRTQAEDSLRRALELDPTLGDAMAWTGYLAMQFEHDFDGAERTLRRAVEVDPNSAVAHEVYGNLLAATGRHRESAREFEVALSLDPLSYLILANAGLCAHRARAFARAVEFFRRQIALNPELPMAHGMLALSLAQLGRHAEAVEAGRRCAALFGTVGEVIAALAAAGAGLVDDARHRLSACEQLRTHQNVWLVGLAMAYAAIGERESALARLEEAYAARDFWMVWLNVQPELDPLRDDPRFQALVQNVHLDRTSC